MPRPTRNKQRDTERPPACPVCGYDQSGYVASWTDACPLTGACSECGAAIEWREVFRPELYEQKRYAEHPEAKIPRDLIRTAMLTLRPKRLWSWVPRSQPLAPGKLLAASGVGMIASVVLVPALLLLATLGAMHAASASMNQPVTGAGVPVMLTPASNGPPLGFLKNHLRHDLSVSDTISVIVFGFHASGVVVAALWALLARHRGVQLRHILRFALLSTVPLSLIVNVDLGFVCLAGVYWYDPNGMYAWLDPVLAGFELGLLASFILAALWIGRAWILFLSRYLRARRPVLTALAYGLIAFLLFPAFMFVVSEIMG